MTRAVAQDLVRQSNLLAAVLDRSSDAVVEQDLDGVIQAWNPAAARFLGGADDALAGQSFSTFVDREHAEQWRGLLAGGRRGESASLSRVILRRHEGLAVHASLSLIPIRDASAAVVGSCVVIQDLTERRLAQETLALGEERVRRSEALAGVGSFVLDGSYQSVQWSEGMYRIFSVTPGAFDGSREAHLAQVHPDDRAAVAAALDAPLRDGTSTELDHRALVDDRTVWIFLAAEPVRDDTGRVTGVRGVCQDVTARKHAEASVRSALELAERANDELRALDVLKDEFLATVSHELRTPLTAIIGFTSMLTKTSPELSKYVEPIARNGRDMVRMIESLLDFSRLQAGQVVINAEVVDLAAEVDRALEVYRTDRAHGTLHNAVPAGLRLVSDRNALERILGNLIGNACRYAGATATVQVRAQPGAEGSIVLAVADDGPGIPAEFHHRLFERFFQVPGAGMRRGTGIGLAVVHEYVSRLGGEVWCESTVGEGTTFLVRLPPSAATPPP